MPFLNCVTPTNSNVSEEVVDCQCPLEANGLSNMLLYLEIQPDVSLDFYSPLLFELLIDQEAMK